MLLFSPHIRTMLWVVFALSGIGLLLAYVLPRPARQNELPGGQPDETGQLTGVVKDYGSNRNGDVDELLISNADGDTWVHFMPHTARQVMKLAGKGTTIIAVVRTGPPHPPPGGYAGPGHRYQLVRLQAGDAVLSIENIPPPPPGTGKLVELNGRVDSLITGKDNDISGLVVDGYQVTLPPHLAHSIAPLLQKEKTIAVKGYERNVQDGFVNTGNYKLIKPFRMTIDGTDYLL